MLRLDGDRIKLESYKHLFEQYMYEQLMDSKIFEVSPLCGVEIYAENDECYLVEPYIVIDEIEYYYGEYIDTLSKRNICDVLDYFVNAIYENEDYYLALHYKLPIHVK